MPHRLPERSLLHNCGRYAHCAGQTNAPQNLPHL